MDFQTIPIKDYLIRKGISFRESNGELIAKCLFNDCDRDSRGYEAHLYLSIRNGQYQCKKCGEQGNIVTLAKFFGDELRDIVLNPFPTKPLAKIYSDNRSTTKIHQLAEACHKTLPDRIRAYLNSRGIPDNLINTYKLGWGKFYSKWWITIPISDKDENFLFIKLRKDPGDKDNLDKFKFYPSGSAAELYGWESLKNNDERAVICEGEFDRLVLLTHGIPAITSTAGAGTFKKEWLDHFSRLKNIYVCFDADTAGDKGAERVIKMFSEKFTNINVCKIDLKERLGKDYKDVTDYFTKNNGNVDEFIYQLPRKIAGPTKPERIKKVEKVEREVVFDEWENTIKYNFQDLVFPAEVSLSIISQLLIKDVTNPFALVLVDVPSAGKTIAINFFAEIEGLTYATDKFTPASFVSNSANIKKKDLKDIDLLPRLRYKMFLIRDLATLFSKRDDDLNECLGTLTRVLDGEGFNADTGVHGQRHYTGEYLFMILAGSTPISPRVWRMMGSLGSRLFFLNMNSKDKTDEELVHQLTTTAYKEKEKVCRKITQDFLLTLWHKHQEGVDWNKDADPRELLLIIAKCAGLLAKLRGVIQVWKEKNDDGVEYGHTVPVIEKPDRINQLFYNLCRGHALVCGRTQINEEDLRLIIELAIDSAPTIRAKLFRLLIENGGQLKTSDVEKYLHCSKPTALKEMETLRILGVCFSTFDVHAPQGQDEKIIKLGKDYEWFITDEARQLRGMGTLPKPLEQDTLSDLI